MENIKRVFSKKFIIVLSATILVMVAAGIASVFIIVNIPTEEGQYRDNISWKYYAATGRLVVSGTGVMRAGSTYKDIMNPFPFDEKKYFIKSVEIEEGITKITGHYFADCVNLENLRFPKSMTDMHCWLYNDISLKEIVIPDGVTGCLVANGDKKLEKITIPASMEEIAMDCFERCDKLTDIYYGGTKEQWEELMGNYLERFEEEHKNVTVHYDYKY